MRYQSETPANVTPIPVGPKHKPPIHFIDEQDRIWWHCDRRVYMFGKIYPTGWYLKEAVYKLNNAKYTLTDLKKMVGRIDENDEGFVPIDADPDWG